MSPGRTRNSRPADSSNSLRRGEDEGQDQATGIHACVLAAGRKTEKVPGVHGGGPGRFLQGNAFDFGQFGRGVSDQGRFVSPASFGDRGQERGVRFHQQHIQGKFF